MSNFDLTISPAQIEYLLKPGVTIIQAYQITNNSSDNIYLNTELLPFIPQGNNASVLYKNISPNPDITFSLSNSDFQLNQAFILPPQSTQQLVLKIKTSPNIQLNDFYYTFFVYQQPSSLPSNFTQATGRIGSHILLSLSHQENLNPTGQITNFSIQPKIKDIFFTQLTFKGEIKNNSDHFFKTNGQIKVTKNDQLIQELLLQDNNILSHHYRQLNCQDQNICSLKSPFWPGKYTATLELDPNLNIPSSSISFFIFPISPIILTLFLITVFLVLKNLKNLINQIKNLFKRPSL